MASQKDTQTQSSFSLEEALERFRVLSKERKQSKKPFLKAQSLTLKELRELGIGTEPRLVVSTGLRKNQKESQETEKKDEEKLKESITY